MPNLIYSKVPKKRTIRAYLNAGFSAERNNVSGKFVPTFFDKECTKAECYAARRSFNDIMSIVKVHFPKTTSEGLAHRLLRMVKMKELSCIFCPQINKLVFYKKDPASDFTTNPRTLGILFSYKGVDNLSADDLLEMAKDKRKRVENKRIPREST